MASASNNLSVKYHDIFDYKLTKTEAIRWQYKKQRIKISKAWPTLLVKKRLQREKYSKKKLKIAKNAANLISKIPTVLFVGVTGSLAMMNAGKNSDIDLMIVTKKNTLWLTRLCVYFILHLTSYILRRPRVKNERDALCLNMWLDESDLIWNKKERNIYTAHEIAQIVPLINKDNTYQKFLYLNRWILDYWPNAVAVQSTEYVVQRQQKLSTKYYVLGTILEHLAFKIQYLYMKSKITREVVTPTRAIFHPNDLAKVILDKLST